MLDDGFAVGWHPHEAAERSVMPVAGTQDDGDDARLAPFVTLHRAHHFDVVAVVGRDEVRADQQQNNVRAVELVVDLAVEILAGADAAIVPGCDRALAAEPGEVLLEFVAQRFVRVRIREEDMGHGGTSSAARWCIALAGAEPAVSVSGTG